MSLIKCPECGKEVSDKATSCPGCGFPLAKNESLLPQSTYDQEKTEFVVVNGVRINPKEIYLKNNKHQTNTLNEIMRTTGASKDEARELLHYGMSFAPKEEKNKKKSGNAGVWIVLILIGAAYIFLRGTNDDADESANNANGASVIESSYENNSSVTSSGSESISEEEYKNLCVDLDYEDILRSPGSYEDKKCIVTGNVSQVIEGWFDSYIIYIEDSNENKWECSYKYKESETHLLENDEVTIYGICDGTSTSTTVLGKQVVLPHIKAEYIECDM